MCAMSLKEHILQIIEKKTSECLVLNNLNVNAEDIATELGVKRNTVSHYLNELVREDNVIKINTRPVIFVAKKVLQKQRGLQNLKNEYSSLRNLIDDTLINNDTFNSVIGAKESLYGPIRQLKSAANYPNEGLPVLLTGPTGSGKSFLARKYFDYNKFKGYIATDKKFVQLNCAEYADNPELLSSLLFGYKKGAFTGADTDKKGLFDEADGGMLFLDEIHRLDAKGQEKLFGYLDNHMISPLGSTQDMHKVSVRFICATTEDIRSSFLKTFIRRIPIQIEIPSLMERQDREKERLILSLYFSEAKKMEDTIYLSRQVLNMLLHHNYSSNIGQLKNIVTISVANSLSKFSVTNEHRLVITVSDLPNHFLELSRGQANQNDLSQELIAIDPYRQLFEVEGNLNESGLIEQICFKLESKSTITDDSQELLKFCLTQVESLCDQLMYKEIPKGGSLPLNFIRDFFSIELGMIENVNHIKLLGNVSMVISNYFYYKQFEHVVGKFNGRKYLKILTDKDSYLNQIVQELLNSIEKKLNITLDDFDYIFVNAYLLNVKYEVTIRPIRSIILAHGYSTASSIADVINKLMGENIFDSFDMPLDISVSEIGEKLTQYIERQQINKGLLLLVDMGSLEGISEFIASDVDFPIGIITNVSTQAAMAVAEKVIVNSNLEDIITYVEQNINQKTEILYPITVKSNLIITCCQTGIGTAERIKNLLEDSLPKSLDVKIISYDYRDLMDEEKITSLKKSFNILAVIGTAEVDIIGIPYIGLEDLISENKTYLLKEVIQKINSQVDIEKINANILRNFSLERVLNSLTILDVQTVMKNIDTMMIEYERISGGKLCNQTKMALYVHVSCLIERLIRREEIQTYPDENLFLNSEANQILSNLKFALSVIEKMYSVKIPQSELGYIYDILLLNQQ